jgi:predicted nucleic acid-binding protein
MIVLDTNVVSELMRQAPSPNVIAWVDQHPSEQVFVTAITAAEILFGIARLPDGRRRSVLAARTGELLEDDFAGRVLAFDGAAAVHYAQIVASRELRGRRISMADAQIAAICCLYGAVLATRNVKDFLHTEIEVCDPWDIPAEP